MAFLKSVVYGLSVCCFAKFVICSVEAAGKIHRAGPRPIFKNGVNTVEFPGDLSLDYNPWFYALCGTLLVGLAGIFPLLVIPVEAGHKLREGVSADRLKLLLSFAVGGLLGDVFLHLLPEAFSPVNAETAHDDNLRIGLWIMGGIFTFLVLEKIFQDQESIDVSKSDTKEKNEVADGHACNGSSPVANGSSKHQDLDIRKRTKESNSKQTEKTEKCSHNEQNAPPKEKEIKVVGYLNLLANCIDNFTHGLAVSGSFLLSRKVGLLTTFAILLHEIPHEIGDFAILLKSGFRRWDAAWGQILTATGGLVGAIFGLVFADAGDSASWVLPFTSGGFIYIALVTIVPELLEEQRPWESAKQVLCMLAGIISMGMVSLIH